MAASDTATKNVPNWKVSGDWFDVCKCNMPCPCEFAQAPTYGECDGVLAYHINKGNYGETALDGLNILALAGFKGNIWPNRDLFFPSSPVCVDISVNITFILRICPFSIWY
jgi:hypothetical protein